MGGQVTRVFSRGQKGESMCSGGLRPGSGSQLNICWLYCEDKWLDFTGPCQSLHL